ncbi:MAG: PD-(D/E)XK nuclease family protein [Deltaproteobacteria bacterium]|nr:PD-(D/E)XK nuclease family protein [Deltaproteobacteria bacterium]
MQNRLSTLAVSLAAYCKAHPVQEKWLLVPSAVVGRQFLDGLALGGTATFNVHVFSLNMLARRLASVNGELPELLSGYEQKKMVETVFTGTGSGEGYLSALRMTPGFLRRMVHMVSDLRMAGVAPGALELDAFENAQKGEEIKALFAGYEALRKASNKIDFADVYHRAIGAAQNVPERALGGAHILASADMIELLSGLGAELWEALPADSKSVLPVDAANSGLEDLTEREKNVTPAKAGVQITADSKPFLDSRLRGNDDFAPFAKPSLKTGEPTDAGLLRWISSPLDAPQAQDDGTASIFAAIGEINEVREMLRRVFAAGKLDDAEVIVTDADTYAPLIYETLFSLSEDVHNVPVTFSTGTPALHTKPARLMMALITWLKNGCYQKEFGRMLVHHLLQFDYDVSDDKSISARRAKEAFYDAPIGKGAMRYLPVLNNVLANVDAEIENAHDDKTRNKLITRKAVWTTLTPFFALFFNKEGELIPANIVAGLQIALDAHCKVVGEADKMVRKTLLQVLAEIQGDAAALEVSVDEFLDDLLAQVKRVRLQRRGPVPGCLYVSTLNNGGYSGRPNVFVMGMDNGRFPGKGLQDPLLLDHEREAISNALPTAKKQLKNKRSQAIALFVRLSGNITLSFCRASLSDDRALFPAWPVESAYRILSNNRHGTQEDLFKWLKAPVSFAPYRDDAPLDAADWIAQVLCADTEIENKTQLVRDVYPNLKQGYVAMEARQSDVFTEYDGCVPEAGADYSPYKPDARPMSPSRLEGYARNPLEFFFRQILGVEVPDEPLAEETEWLDAASRGTLLHTVFERFMRELAAQGEKPKLSRHHERITAILNEEIETAKNASPSPSEEMFRRAVADMQRTVEIFLRNEEKHCETVTPAYFELSVGIESEVPEDSLSSAKPVAVHLGDGKHLRIRGKIDRIACVIA